MRLAISAVLLWTALAQAAVSYNAANTAVGIDVTSLTVSGHVLTCPGGNPLILGLISQGGASYTGAPTSVVWNGSELLTQIATVPLSGNPGRVSLWARAAGTTATTANLVVTWASQTRGVVAAMSLCGVHQSTPLGTAVTREGTIADNLTDTLTVPANGLGVEVFVEAGDRAVTVAAGTQRYNLTDGGTNTRGAASTRPDSGTMGWNWVSGFEYVGHILVPVNPSIATTRRRTVGVFFP